MMNTAFECRRLLTGLVIKHAAGLLVLMLAASDACADIRLLVEFSGEDHRVVRVIRSTEARYRSPSLHAELGKKLLTGNLAAHRLIVRWFDSNGALMAIEDMQDPRVAHAPWRPKSDAELAEKSQSPGDSVEYTRLSAGTYLLTGPDLAAEVVVSLPALQLGNVQLPAKQMSWSLESL